MKRSWRPARSVVSANCSGKCLGEQDGPWPPPIQGRPWHESAASASVFSPATSSISAALSKSGPRRRPSQRDLYHSALLTVPGGPSIRGIPSDSIRNAFLRREVARPNQYWAGRRAVISDRPDTVLAVPCQRRRMEIGIRSNDSYSIVYASYSPRLINIATKPS